MYRFILTMWNVNVKNLYIISESIFSFYINYVECKSVISLYNLQLKVGFILTMWNVNELINMNAGNKVNTFYINYVECK